jgi:hypothetical protein
MVFQVNGKVENERTVYQQATEMNRQYKVLIRGRREDRRRRRKEEAKKRKYLAQIKVIAATFTSKPISLSLLKSLRPNARTIKASRRLAPAIIL